MKTWLTDVLPPKARKYVYAVGALTLVGIAGYEASQGDILKTIVFVLTTLGFGMAASNTDVKA